MAWDETADKLYLGAEPFIFSCSSACLLGIGHKIEICPQYRREEHFRKKFILLQFKVSE